MAEDKRAKILRRDGWRCWYCGVELPRSVSNLTEAATLDHVLPLSRGGTNAESNLVACCRQCNSRKKTRTLSEYRAYLGQQIHPEARALTHIQKALEEIDFPAEFEMDRIVMWLQSIQPEIVFYGERNANL